MPSCARDSSPTSAHFNAILDAMAEFRSVHYGWAQEYINRRTDDPRGTGGHTLYANARSADRRKLARSESLDRRTVRPSIAAPMLSG